MIIKKLSLIVFVLGLVFLSSSKSVFKSNPPGTIWLTDSLYVDQYPVKIKDYVEFLYSIKSFYNESLHDSIEKLPLFGLSQNDMIGLQEHFKGDSLMYLQMLTRTWMTYANDERKYDIDFRLKSQRYLNFPIVNITYEQMRYYCQWRTDMVKIYYAISCKTEKQRRKYPMNFKFRMIKRKEWEKIIATFLSDIKRSETANKEGGKPDNLVKPYEYQKKRNFYYDVDNVAETLENAVVTFNFTWNDRLNLGNISYFKLEEPSDWISFRCICEILPEK